MMLSNASPANSKASFRAKAKGLRINTDVPPDLLPCGAQNAAPSSPTGVVSRPETFTQLVTAPATKQTFNIENNKPTESKVSEAMLNTDWRNNRRTRDALPTAPAKKVQFSKDEIKPRKPHLDPVATTSSGVRRYRDSPIDPEFILSAPATKMEFGVVCNNQDELEYHTARSQSPSGEDSRGKEPVKLESFDSVSDAYDMAKRLAHTIPTKPGSDSSSVMVVSPVLRARGLSEAGFPLVEIEAVKDGKRFHAQNWHNVDNTLKKSLKDMRGPLTAGLPIDKLRHDFERLRKKQEAEQQRREDTERFEAFVKKLQKSQPSRSSAIDIKPPFWSEDQNKENKTTAVVTVNRGKTKQQKAPIDPSPSDSTASDPTASDPSTDRASCDSAISDMSIDHGKKLGHLNPTAAEFSIPSKTVGQPKKEISLEDFYAVCERLAKVESELAAKEKGSPMEDGALYHLGISPVEGQIQATGTALEHNGAYHQMNGSLLNQPAWTQASAQQPHAGVPQHTAQNQFLGNPMSMIAASPMASPPMVSPVMLHNQQNMPMAHGAMVPQRMITPAGPQFGPQPHPQSAPVYVHNQLANGLQTQGAVPAWSNQTPFGGPQSAVMMPNPVRRPKGPLKAGDTQQLHYEAYLEYKRSTDPNYAQECRARQAKRAARQKSAQK